MSGRAEGGAARIRAVASFPTGSVTFLITDIEGSTRLLIALEEQGWNVSKVSRTLGIARSSLYRKLERYGLLQGGRS